MASESHDAQSVSQAAPRANRQSIAVIGGSAAGLLTAAVLARKGLPVRVFERIETLEHPERTLIVTNRMRHLLGSAAEKSGVNQIRRFELFTDARCATLELDEPDLIIERRALIQSLAQQAAQAGASVELGRRFHSLQPNGPALVLEVEL